MTTLALFGCAGPSSSDAAKNAATERWAACAITAAFRVDDGTSDAATVAIGAAAICQGEYREQIKMMAQGMTRSAAEALYRRMESAEVRQYVGIILHLRTDKARPRPNRNNT